MRFASSLVSSPNAAALVTISMLTTNVAAIPWPDMIAWVKIGGNVLTIPKTPSRTNVEMIRTYKMITIQESMITVDDKNQ